MAAGLASSMAQNVYSLNVVGYVNVTVTPGYTLCANQLITDTNGIGEVLPNPPDNAYVLTFVNSDYNADQSQGGAWYDANSGNPSTTQLPPGVGWFYSNPGSTTTLTLVGTVPQGTGTINLNAGYTLIGTYTPQVLVLDPTNGFPLPDNTYCLTFDNLVTHDYVAAQSQGGAWYDANSGNPETVAPAVGQGYFINAPSAASWSYSFTVQ